MDCCQDVSGDSSYNLPQQIPFFFILVWSRVGKWTHRSRALSADTLLIPYRRPRRFQKVSKAPPSRSDPFVVPAIYPRGSSTGVFTNRPSTTAPHFIRINNFGRFFNFDGGHKYILHGGTFFPFPVRLFSPLNITSALSTDIIRLGYFAVYPPSVIQFYVNF